MAAGWYISRQGEKVGPVSSAELKRLAASGELRPADMVMKEGMAKWVQASAVKGLFNGSDPGPHPPTVSTAHTEHPEATTETAAKTDERKENERGFFTGEDGVFRVWWRGLSKGKKIALVVGCFAVLWIIGTLMGGGKKSGQETGVADKDSASKVDRSSTAYKQGYAEGQKFRGEFAKTYAYPELIQNGKFDWTPFDLSEARAAETGEKMPYSAGSVQRANWIQGYNDGLRAK